MTNTPIFRLTHITPAPLPAVWDAWTNIEQLSAWFGPKGFPITTSTLDVREGGIYHYGIPLPTGQTMWGRWVFRTITPHHTLAWDHHFSDAHGTAITRHPFSPTWPLHMHAELTFSPHPNGTQLDLTFTATPTTDDELTTWRDNQDNMRTGWSGTLEQLDAFVGG